MSEVRPLRIRRLVPTMLVLLAAAGGGVPAHAQQPAAPPERLTFSHLLPEDGLPSVQLRRIIQDRQGFMWFATYEGLVRFDSRAFRTFRHDAADPRTISSNTTWDLIEDARGDIWVGSDGGLDVWRRDTEDFAPIAGAGDDHHRLSSPFVRRLLLDGETGLWIGTFGGGLNRLDRRTGRVQVHRARPGDPHALPDDYILDLFRDSRGTIWIGTQSAGLTAFDPSTGRFRTYRHDPGDPRSLAGARVSAIGEDAEGSLWVGTTGGLSRLDRDRRVVERVPFVAGDPAALQGSKVDAIARDRDGAMWIGTDGGGLSRLDPATRALAHFRHVRGDPTTPVSNVVPAFYQDRAGDYWVGHWPWGVSYANRLNASIQLVRTIPGQPGTIPDDTIHALLEDPSGDLWVGTDNAGLCRYSQRDRAWTSHLPPVVPGRPVAKAVMAILRDSAGRIWSGTWRGGVTRFDPRTGQTTQFRAGSGPGDLSSDFVLGLVEDRLGRIWVSTFGGGVNRYQPETNDFVSYRHDPGNPRTLNHDGVGCLMVSRNGTLWAGTQAGLARWDPATGDWARVECAASHPGTLAGNFVNDILEASDGNLWVATAGGGLNHMNLSDGRCQAVGPRDGLPGTVVRSVVADDRGALWMGTTEGLVFFDPATRRVRIYDESNGVHGRVFNRGARRRLADGRLMMGGAGGFEIFDPRRLGPDDTVPPVVLTGLEILNEAVRPGASPLLPRSLGSTQRLEVPSRAAAVISLQFAALDYRSPKRTRLEYLLEGFDRGWRASGPERRATYTNLNPGTYRFRVRAAGADGAWRGPGAALTLVVVPAWWQTWWFRSGLGAGFAALLVGGSLGVSRKRYRDQLLAARRETDRAREQQRVSDVIRENEERLEMALLGADLGTWDWDVASGRLVFSRRSAGIIGYREDELPPHQQAWRDHMHPDDRDVALRALYGHLRGESSNYEAEYRLRHKDGHWVWVLARGRTIAREDDGTPRRVTGTHLDITERKQAEEQQRTLEALLAQSQKMESVGRLAGGVAHDLNNMLTPILGHCELLSSELPPADPQQASLREIRRAAERSRDLVAQLLAFARKQTLEMKRVDLNWVIRDVDPMLRRTLRASIALDYDLGTALPPMRGDTLQLQQILINLAMNAQDAMPDGGRLFIETTLRTVDADGPPDVVPPGRYVVLTVSDSGVGMDRATVEQIFEPFFTTKDMGRGTGLGLATVHGIVEQHGAHIHVDTDVGRGTIFTVHFPAQPEEALVDDAAPGATGPADLAAARPVEDRGVETILLVEDQAQVRDLCVLVLSRAGYTVLAAASAAAALELSARHRGPIDLLLTDVVLPDINGRALFEQLAGERPALRVIYMSGYPTNVITQHGVLDAGLSYLQKPFDGEGLKAKIRQVLDADAEAVDVDVDGAAPAAD